MPVAPLPCPLCAGFIQVDSDWSGREVAYPLCGGAFVVPLQATSHSSPVSPQPPPPPPHAVSSDDADLLPPGAAAPGSRAVTPPLDGLLPRGAAWVVAPPAIYNAAPKPFAPIVTPKPVKSPALRQQPPSAPAVA